MVKWLAGNVFVFYNTWTIICFSPPPTPFIFLFFFLSSNGRHEEVGQARHFSKMLEEKWSPQKKPKAYFSERVTKYFIRA